MIHKLKDGTIVEKGLPSKQELSKVLNGHGQDGWELVAVAVDAADTTTCYLKRSRS